MSDCETFRMFGSVSKTTPQESFSHDLLHYDAVIRAGPWDKINSDLLFSYLFHGIFFMQECPYTNFNETKYCS